MASEAILKQEIRAKVVELARALGRKADRITDDDTLLAMGILDSTAVLELLVWIEGHLDIELDPGELSLDNFGSINLMAAHLAAMGDP